MLYRWIFLFTILLCLLKPQILLAAESFESRFEEKNEHIQWLPVPIPSELNGKHVLLQIPSARLLDYKIYSPSKEELHRITQIDTLNSVALKSRYPLYSFVAKDSIYYLKIPSSKSKSTHVTVQSPLEFAKQESSTLLYMGVYYGIAMMSILFNLIFYLIFKDNRYLTYCILLFTTFLSFFYEDGLFYFMSEGKLIMPYFIVWNTSITAIFALLFTIYFLNLDSTLQFYKRYFIIGVLVLFCFAFLFTITGNNIYENLNSIICFIFALTGIYLAIIRFKKDVYARFLTLSFTLVVLTGMGYSLNSYVNSEIFSFFDLSTFRMLSAIEIISISFAITLKVKNLQDNINSYKEELNNYLKDLEIQNQTSSFVESKDQMATNLKVKFNLTDREIDVLLCLWNGLSNQEIADSLFISVSTVKYHLSNLYLKLEVKNRTQAQVLRQNLVMPV